MTRASAIQQELPLEVPEHPPLITVQEAQRWLDVSPEAFARLLLSGRLPLVHIGRKTRIEETTLLALLAERGTFRGTRGGVPPSPAGGASSGPSAPEPP
jgi:excisionase family DNA binding protein